MSGIIGEALNVYFLDHVEEGVYNSAKNAAITEEAKND